MGSPVLPGDVAVMPLAGGAFGACQVTGVDGQAITAYALRWRSADPPALDDLRGIGPLLLDHHRRAACRSGGQPAFDCANDGGLAQVTTVRRQDPVPPDFEWLGNLPVPEGVPASTNRHSGWRTLANDVAWQHRWDHELPAAAKSAYRAAATRGQVQVDFGAGPVTLLAALSRLDLAAGRPVPVPAAGPLDWSGLDRLPRCTTLTWAGPDRGLSNALAGHPIVSDLTWRAAPPVVDLAGTGLLSLRLAGAGLREVRLPACLQRLELEAAGPGLAVHAADGGRWIDLTVRDPQPGTVIPEGLRRVRHLVLDGDGVVPAAPLAGLGDLRTLRVRWRRPPGTLADAARLAGLTRLAEVRLWDGYGLDADTLPDLPSLTWLDLHGLRRSIVPALRARYRGTAVTTVIGGAKDDTWLAANLDNPFRDWVDDHPRGGAAACKAYGAAVRAVDKLPDGARRLAAAEAVLRTLVGTLNGIDRRYEFIDTLRREQAWDAFAGLAARAGVPTELADRWFDEERDF